MKRRTLLFWFYPLICFLLACNTLYKPGSLEYKSYKISGTQQQDPSLVKLLKPYSDSIHKTMNDPVGFADESLDKKMPEGTLGNFMVDAFLAMAREKYGVPVDLAVLNHGGIRLTQLAQGPVTRGKIFELMPFDNLLILQKIKGDVLQQFLDFIAAKGGWPVAGMSMQIKNLPTGQAGKKAVNVMIGGIPLNHETIYTMANSDFLANGGDNADMLRPIPQITNGYLMRDAIFDYIIKLKSEGKNITARIENRISYAE